MVGDFNFSLFFGPKDPKASYDYNNNDTDPMPLYTWREDNRYDIMIMLNVKFLL